MLHIHMVYRLNFWVKLDKGGQGLLLKMLRETRSKLPIRSKAWQLQAEAHKHIHTLKKMRLRWRSHSAKKANHTDIERDGSLPILYVSYATILV